MLTIIDWGDCMSWKQLGHKLDITREENKAKFIIFMVVMFSLVAVMSTRLGILYFNKNYTINTHLAKEMEPVGKAIYEHFNHTDDLTVRYGTLTSETVLGLYTPPFKTIDLREDSDVFTYVHEYFHHVQHIHKLPFFSTLNTPYNVEELTDILAFYYIIDERNPHTDYYDLKVMYSNYVLFKDMAFAKTQEDTQAIIDYYLDFEFNQ